MSAPLPTPMRPWQGHPAALRRIVPGAPSLTAACADPLHEIEVVDDSGERRRILVPLERPLTIYVDRQELVTLMTLGAMPELLVLGYLRNQGLIDAVQAVAAIQVDWQVQAAAVTTHAGVADLPARLARRVLTTGCGQGTVFGDALSALDAVQLPDASKARIDRDTLHGLLEVVRAQDSIHRRSGSVHGCALFQGIELLAFVEDVGRHNAIDAIAGWMGLHGIDGADKVFYTTGRLTSEMVMKSARMGIPIVVSRNGVTQLGHALADSLGMALIGRAAGRRFICYTGAGRLDFEAGSATMGGAAP